MRVFEILDKLNQSDDERNPLAAKVVLCPTFVRSQTTKRGIEITMGADASLLPDMLNSRLTPILLLVDMEEYKKIQPKGGAE